MWAFWIAFLAFLFLPLEITVETTSLKKGEFLEWLKKFRRSKGVALFGILLAGMSDKSAGEVINDTPFREDIARFSAEDCWFLYFTQQDSAQSKQRTPHEQHAIGVHAIAQWLELDIKEMPCFVFFENTDYDHYLYVPLKGRSKEEIMEEIRVMFNQVREEKQKQNFSTYRAIENYRAARKIKTVGRSLRAFFYTAGLELAAKVISQTQQPTP